MAWSKLDIINLTFNILNKNSVTSLTDSGEFAQAAGPGFDLLYPSCISSQSWRFATRIVQLSRLPDAPPIKEWSYRFQLPTDYLSNWRLHPQQNFQIYGNELWANLQEIKMEYRALVDPTYLPAYFVHYFVLLLAAWYAKAVAQDEALSKDLNAEADKQLGTALFTDSQAHPIEALHNNPIINARNNGWGSTNVVPYN